MCRLYLEVTSCSEKEEDPTEPDHTSRVHWETDEFCFVEILRNLPGLYCVCCAEYNQTPIVSEGVEEMMVWDVASENYLIPSWVVVTPAWKRMDPWGTSQLWFLPGGTTNNQIRLPINCTPASILVMTTYKWHVSECLSRLTEYVVPEIWARWTSVVELIGCWRYGKCGSFWRTLRRTGRRKRIRFQFSW